MLKLLVSENLRKIVNSRGKKKLYLKLRGGFGNQLFIYMAGLCIAYKKDLKLVIDARGIDHLESIEVLEPPGEFRKGRIYWRLRQIFNLTKIDYENLTLEQRQNLIEMIEDNSMLTGFFQTPEFFEELKTDGLNLTIDFKRTQLLFPKEVKSLSKANVALIHIRGGDFIHHRLTIGLLGAAYYEQVFIQLKERGVESLVVMTDDIAFAQKLIAQATFASVNFISKNERISNFEYLSLFAFPDYIVLSNSTFAWWGAQFAKSKSMIFSPDSWNRTNANPQQLTLNHWQTQPSVWQ